MVTPKTTCSSTAPVEGTAARQSHSPWQRGQVENLNRQLRWWFPRGTDLANIAPTAADHAATTINNQHRQSGLAGSGHLPHLWVSLAASNEYFTLAQAEPLRPAGEPGLVASGLTNSASAGALFVAKRTVENHQYQASARLGVIPAARR